MKTFKGDFDKFKNFLTNKNNFSIVRFGDGELMIIEGVDLNLLNKGVGEFAYDSKDEKYNISRDLLEKSFRYVDDNYFVGIACKCCVGHEKFEYMKESCKQPLEHLTWANIFVNGNFQYFNSEIIPILKTRRIRLITHELSNIDNLPFTVEKTYRIKTDAWLHNLDLIDIIKSDIDNEELEDIVFLASAGPFANILVQQLHEYNKNNTYIDLGSVLDGHFKLPLTRGYLKGAPTLNKICIW